VFSRQFWNRRISEAWSQRPVIWLMGVRRAGKTVLAQSVPGVRYLDCELPGTRALVADPESFLGSVRGESVVLDEIHRLGAPAELLKIAADHFPDVRIVATGSSTLSASSRFRDTLTGRKREVWLTPMTLEDAADFGSVDLRHRLLHGGLPEFFLSLTPPAAGIEEWIDAFWARDILELFRLERRASFRRLFELVMAHSGGIFEASRFARPCEASRTTVANYLAVLDATFAAHIVRPYAEGGRAEIVSAPKVYGFDTGFVCHYRGITALRAEDLGLLWEHLVLNELHAHVGRLPIRYWRTKRGSEIDFVLVRHGRPPVAIECKWSASDFDPAAMKSFRGAYPGGPSFVVTADTRDGQSYERQYGPLRVLFVSARDLVRAAAEPPVTDR
jgi:predicted AAA+ superfamily ATPase